jgi:hypothetical protein
MAETTYREILLVVESAGAPRVLLHVPGQEQTLSIDLNPVRNFRHHRGAEVLVADVPAPPGAWLEVGSSVFYLDDGIEVLEVAQTAFGWEEGAVAADASPMTPIAATVWQVPALGWLSWGLLAIGFLVLARRQR